MLLYFIIETKKKDKAFSALFNFKYLNNIKYMNNFENKINRNYKKQFNFQETKGIRFDQFKQRWYICFRNMQYFLKYDNGHGNSNCAFEQYEIFRFLDGQKYSQEYFLSSIG